jgi:diacylglycerol kinase (ATP)
LRPAALIYNPKAGRWRAPRLLEDLVSLLERGGFAVEALATTAPGDATRLAGQVVAQGAAEVLFVLGGDGTVREAAKPLLGSRVALAPLPAGTANVVAHSLGLPSDPVQAARAFGGLPVLEIDAGLCGDEPFLMLASAGLDSWVMERVNEWLKGHLGKVGVGLQGIPEWLRYDYRKIRVVADNRPLEGTLVAVCNMPYYAGSYRLIPEARFDDRRLELLVFHGEGRAATLAFAADLLRERHVERQDVEILPVDQAVRFEGPVGTHLQLDGDACSLDLPLTVEMAPEPLRVLAPRGRTPER